MEVLVVLFVGFALYSVWRRLAYRYGRAPGTRICRHLALPSPARMKSQSGFTAGVLYTDMVRAVEALTQGCQVLPLPREESLAMWAGLWRSEKPQALAQIEVEGRPLPALALYLASFEGQPLVVNRLSKGLEVGYGPAGAEQAGAFLRQVDAWGRRHTALRGKLVTPVSPGQMRVVEPTGGVEGLEVRDMGTVEAPVLAPEAQECVDRGLMAFLRRRERLRQVGISGRRGVLLTGPPGTGKTSLVRWVVSQCPECVSLVVRNENLDLLRTVFQRARELAPSLVILEDVDLLAINRYQNSYSLFLGALMAELDGLESNSDVFVLMTSNDTREMEAALIRRPGRVDQIISVGLPDQAGRGRVLERLSRLYPMPGRPSWEGVARESEGLSPAALQEIYKQAIVRALERGASEVETGDFLAVIPGLREQLGDMARAPKIGLRPLEGSRRASQKDVA